MAEGGRPWWNASSVTNSLMPTPALLPTPRNSPMMRVMTPTPGTSALTNVKMECQSPRSKPPAFSPNVRPPNGTSALPMRFKPEPGVNLKTEPMAYLEQALVKMEFPNNFNWPLMKWNPIGGLNTPPVKTETKHHIPNPHMAESKFKFMQQQPRRNNGPPPDWHYIYTRERYEPTGASRAWWNADVERALNRRREAYLLTKQKNDATIEARFERLWSFQVAKDEARRVIAESKWRASMGQGYPKEDEAVKPGGDYQSNIGNMNVLERLSQRVPITERLGQLVTIPDDDATVKDDTSSPTKDQTEKISSDDVQVIPKNEGNIEVLTLDDEIEDALNNSDDDSDDIMVVNEGNSEVIFMQKKQGEVTFLAQVHGRLVKMNRKRKLCVTVTNNNAKRIRGDSVDSEDSKVNDNGDKDGIASATEGTNIDKDVDKEENSCPSGGLNGENGIGHNTEEDKEGIAPNAEEAVAPNVEEADAPNAVEADNKDSTVVEVDGDKEEISCITEDNGDTERNEVQHNDKSISSVGKHNNDVVTDKESEPDVSREKCDVITEAEVQNRETGSVTEKRRITDKDAGKSIAPPVKNSSICETIDIDKEENDGVVVDQDIILDSDDSDDSESIVEMPVPDIASPVFVYGPETALFSCTPTKETTVEELVLENDNNAGSVMEEDIDAITGSGDALNVTGSTVEDSDITFVEETVVDYVTEVAMDVAENEVSSDVASVVEEDNELEIIPDSMTYSETPIRGHRNALFSNKRDMFAKSNKVRTSWNVAVNQEINTVESTDSEADDIVILESVVRNHVGVEERAIKPLEDYDIVTVEKEEEIKGDSGVAAGKELNEQEISTQKEDSGTVEDVLRITLDTEEQTLEEYEVNSGLSCIKDDSRPGASDNNSCSGLDIEVIEVDKSVGINLPEAKGEVSHTAAKLTVSKAAMNQEKDQPIVRQTRQRASTLDKANIASNSQNKSIPQKADSKESSSKESLKKEEPSPKRNRPALQSVPKRTTRSQAPPTPQGRVRPKRI